MSATFKIFLLLQIDFTFLVMYNGYLVKRVVKGAKEGSSNYKHNKLLDSKVYLINFLKLFILFYHSAPFKYPLRSISSMSSCTSRLALSSLTRKRVTVPQKYIQVVS